MVDQWTGGADGTFDGTFDGTSYFSYPAANSLSPLTFVPLSRGRPLGRRYGRRAGRRTVLTQELEVRE